MRPRSKQRLEERRFHKALVEGVELGKAAVYGQEINIVLLDQFLKHRVTELTDGAQHPIMQRRRR